MFIFRIFIYTIIKKECQRLQNRVSTIVPHNLETRAYNTVWLVAGGQEKRVSSIMKTATFWVRLGGYYCSAYRINVKQSFKLCTKLSSKLLRWLNKGGLWQQILREK
jgi:hypothetical protein